ncbi:MAG TPA: TolC family protein, partial [Usitatibacter sp.]
MKFRRIALAFTTLAALGCARAADLLAVYHDAQSSDPVYQSARAQYKAAIESLPQARSAYLPLIAGSASVFRNDVDRQIASDISFTTKVYAITLSQPIFRMQSWIAITEAQQQVLQAEALLAGSQQDLMIRVSQAYFDVLLAQDNVALSETQSVAISEQLAQAKRNFE